MPAFFFFIIIILLIIFVQTHKHTRLAYVPAIDCTFLIATRVYNFMFSFSRLLFSHCRFVLHILFGICGPELSAAMCVRVLCWCMLQRELIVCSRFSIARQRRRQRRRQKRHLCVRIDIALPNARWSRYNQRFGYLYAFFPTCNRCLFPFFFFYIFCVRNFFSLFCTFYAIQKKREREEAHLFTLFVVCQPAFAIIRTTRLIFIYASVAFSSHLFHTFVSLGEKESVREEEYTMQSDQRPAQTFCHLCSEL